MMVAVRVWIATKNRVMMVLYNYPDVAESGL